jgi:subtilisin family serine protease
MTNNKFKSFSKNALMAAVLSVSVMAASCTKEDNMNPYSPETSAMQAENPGMQDQYIVTLNENYGGGNQERIQEDANKLFADNGISGATLAKDNIFDAGFVIYLKPAEASALKNDPRVKSVDRDILVNAAQGTMAADATTAQTVSWSVTKVGGAGDGTGKTAWIIDSGIDYNHPDLNVDKTRSRSFLTSDMGGNWSSPSDEFGHGTSVAGIIGAKNDGQGAVGVAAGASLVSLRIMNHAGQCYSSALIKALNHVYTYGKAGDVVNLSVSFAANGTIDYYVQKVASKGIFVAIAAGNNNGDAIYKSPARVNGTNIYTVSGMNSDGSRWSNSNYGATTVDFAAASSDVYTTAKGGGYKMAGGTSMAAPHVAGILLLNGGRVNNSGTVSGDVDGKADLIAKR